MLKQARRLASAPSRGSNSLNRGLLALCCIWPAQSGATQGAEGRFLRPEAARLNGEFSQIRSVRELNDGRVLVADITEQRLFVADFLSGSVKPIGREGSGPGEYRAVSFIHEVGKDSSLTSDYTTGGWLLLEGDRIVKSLSRSEPAVSALRGDLRGADARGFVIATSWIGPEEGRRLVGKKDSVFILRVQLRTGKLDTIGRLRAIPMSINADVSKSGKPISARITRPKLSVGEEPLLFPDGWLALARLEPYRVDWRRPDGGWIHGNALPFSAVPFDSRERRSYVERRSSELGRPVRTSPEDVWPSIVPPFQPFPLLTTPTGNLLIHRTPSADHPGNRYDIVDRTGRLLGWIELGVGKRIAGVGKHGAYVITTDSTGVQHLTRHPWP